MCSSFSLSPFLCSVSVDWRRARVVVLVYFAQMIRLFVSLNMIQFVGIYSLQSNILYIVAMCLVHIERFNVWLMPECCVAFRYFTLSRTVSFSYLSFNFL